MLNLIKFLKLSKHFRIPLLVLFGIIAYLVLSFLRLIPPEITEDAYHTDLPHLYLMAETSMLESREPLHVIPYPQLAEMVYLIPLFFGDKEASHYDPNSDERLNKIKNIIHHTSSGRVVNEVERFLIQTSEFVVKAVSNLITEYESKS